MRAFCGCGQCGDQYLRSFKAQHPLIRRLTHELFNSRFGFTLVGISGCEPIDDLTKMKWASFLLANVTPAVMAIKQGIQLLCVAPLNFVDPNHRELFQNRCEGILFDIINFSLYLGLVPTGGLSNGGLFGSREFAFLAHRRFFEISGGSGLSEEAFFTVFNMFGKERCTQYFSQEVLSLPLEGLHSTNQNTIPPYTIEIQCLQQLCYVVIQCCRKLCSKPGFSLYDLYYESVDVLRPEPSPDMTYGSEISRSNAVMCFDPNTFDGLMSRFRAEASLPRSVMPMPLDSCGVGPTTSEVFASFQLNLRGYCGALLYEMGRNEARKRLQNKLWGQSVNCNNFDAFVYSLRKYPNPYAMYSIWHYFSSLATLNQVTHDQVVMFASSIRQIDPDLFFPLLKLAFRLGNVWAGLQVVRNLGPEVFDARCAELKTFSLFDQLLFSIFLVEQENLSPTDQSLISFMQYRLHRAAEYQRGGSIHKFRKLNGFSILQSKYSTCQPCKDCWRCVINDVERYNSLRLLSVQMFSLGDLGGQSLPPRSKSKMDLATYSEFFKRFSYEPVDSGGVSVGRFSDSPPTQVSSAPPKLASVPRSSSLERFSKPR
jgi:hypothetical protein